MSISKISCYRSEVDVNLKTVEGNTALHHAAKGGFADLVELLLSRPDTDVNLKNRAGEKAVDLVQDDATGQRIADMLSGSQ